jgi:DNA-binding LytR/AlgR family response regulator
MEKYNCIIVEDEPLAAEVLQRYISEVPFLELEQTCANAMDTMEVLSKKRVDLLFLDIHLPKLKGFDFIRTLKNPPKVIVTTAYRDYAVQAFELNAVDYLVKPIEFSRFLTAVSKLFQATPVFHLAVPGQTGGERTHLFFNVRSKRVKVFLDEILYIESLREFIRITTKTKSILTKFQLSKVEEMLKDNNFIRVHRSFIVAREKIDAFSSTEVEINNKQIPIGRSYKELVLGILERSS